MGLAFSNPRWRGVELGNDRVGTKLKLGVEQALRLGIDRNGLREETVQHEGDGEVPWGDYVQFARGLAARAERCCGKRPSRCRLELDGTSGRC